MTTAQAPTNGHRAVPSPCSLPDSQSENRSKDSTDDNSNSIATNDQVVERQKAFAANVYQQDELRGVKKVITPLLAQEKVPFPASAYHVPPGLYAPKADSFRDTIPNGLSAMKLPDRCQFMFSDGRQCTMARSDIHPSVCTYHADREEQLFGDPSHGFVTRKLDFPELFSACRDLSTAAGVNLALGQVFRLLAQRRISRQEAATFAKLAHLLLQSIRAARAEFDTARAESIIPLESSSQGANWSAKAESLPHCTRSPLSMRPSTGGVIPKTSSPISAPTFPDRAEIGRSGEDEESRAGSPTHAPARVTLALSDEVASVGAQPKPPLYNSREINTSENTGLETIQNQHLQEVRRERHSME